MSGNVDIAKLLANYRRPKTRKILTAEELMIHACYMVLEAKEKNCAAKHRRWLRIIEYVSDHDWTCHLCGKNIDKLKDVTLDHVIPRNGKPNGPGELRLAHEACNGRRGNVPLVMWRMVQTLSHNHPIFYKKSLYERTQRQTFETEHRLSLNI